MAGELTDTELDDAARRIIASDPELAKYVDNYQAGHEGVSLARALGAVLAGGMAVIEREAQPADNGALSAPVNTDPAVARARSADDIGLAGMLRRIADRHPSLPNRAALIEASIRLHIAAGPARAPERSGQ